MSSYFPHCRVLATSIQGSEYTLYSRLWIILFVLVVPQNKWYYPVFVFPLWIISLSITPSRFIHVVIHGRISFFLKAKSYVIVYVHLVSSSGGQCMHTQVVSISWLLWITQSVNVGVEDSSSRQWFYSLWVYTQKWRCWTMW